MFISHHPLFLTIYSSQNIHWLVLRGAVNTSQTRPARPKRATQSVTLAEPTTDRRNPPPPQGPIVFSPTGACCSTVQTASCPIQRAHDTNFPCSYFCAQHFKVCQLAQWWISSPWDIGPDFCRKKNQFDFCLLFWNTVQLTTDPLQCWRWWELYIIPIVYYTYIYCIFEYLLMNSLQSIVFPFHIDIQVTAWDYTININA